MGLNVFVFFPEGVDWGSFRVMGYTYSFTEKAWVKKPFPLPHFLYDRFFSQKRASYERYRSLLQKLSQYGKTVLLNQGISGKLQVAQLLEADPELIAYIPKTEVLTAKNLLTWLEQSTSVFLKPQAGSQGKGALHIKKQGSGAVIRGRSLQNEPIQLHIPNTFELLQWIRSFIGRKTYLIQPFLELTTSEGNAYDLRTLMQKNGKGNWQLTGMGIRRGQQGSITSNLHGGGEPEEVEPFLTKQFGKVPCADIMRIVEQLSLRIPPLLESSYGRLLELGIDFGIDREGKVWILEVNSKPGRTLFTELDAGERSENATVNPLRYAKYLADSPLRINRRLS